MVFFSSKRLCRRLLPLLLFACLLCLVCTLHTYAEAPSLTLQGDAAVTYGDDLALRITLSDAAFTPGDAVTLTLAGVDEPIGSAVLDKNGSATVTLAHPANAAEGKLTCRLDKGTQVITATLGDTLSASHTVEVAPRTVTLKNFSVADRVYDGTTAATATHEGLEGVLNEDTVNLVEGVCYFRDRTVNLDVQGAPIPKPASIGGYDLSGTHHYNYELQLPTELTATILPKSIRIEGLVALSRTYNGTTDISLQGYTLNPNDIITDDFAIIGLAPITGHLVSPNAGEQAVVLNKIVLTGAAAGNYAVVTPTVTALITPATLSLSVEQVTINKGQSIPVLTPKVEGFVNGEDMDALEGFVLPTPIPESINTLNVALTSFTVSYEGGNATDNYVFDRTSFATVSLKINTVAPDESLYTVSVEDLSIWHNATITVTPTADYVSITTGAADGSLTMNELSFVSTLLLEREGACTVFFALRHADGTVTEPVELSYRLDVTAPTGDLRWREQSILASGTPVYRYFSKSAIELLFVTDDADGGSGVAKVEYALNEGGPFTRVTDDTAEIAATAGLYRVWLRITDGAGNETLLQTDGMVLYADATASGDPLTHERLSNESINTVLTLKGNALAALTDQSAPLTDGQFSLAEDGTLTLFASYLSALPAGEHRVVLSFLPLGQSYVDLPINDAPSTVILTLTVTRRVATAADFTVTPPEGTTYNGGDKAVTVSAPAGMGEILHVYYFDEAGNRLSVAKNAGTYVIKVDLGTGYDYAAATDLVIGELVIDKMTPTAPILRFEAATGRLDGDIDGLVFSIDGGAFSPLPTDFTGVVREACTLRFYLPGDGINTLDSLHTVIVITRAAAPTVTATDETLFANCDGTFSSSVEGIEYRHESETNWRPVVGATVRDLAPGTYFVRVAALGTALESTAVTVTVVAAPEFVTLEKEASAENQPTVVVKGDLTALASVSLSPLAADPMSGSPIRALSLIDTRTTEIIGYFDLLLNGRHNGALALQITVGEAYNGQTLTVYRENAAGETEVCTLLCEDGVIVLEADAPSPILIVTPMTTPHGRGSAAWIWILVTLGGIALAVCVFFEIRYLRGKKQK